MLVAMARTGSYGKNTRILSSDYMTEIVSATMRQIDRRRHCVNNFELHPLTNIHG